MYFIEKILRLFYGKKKLKITYTPQAIDKCEHVFFPIDSSKEYLACSKCGKIIKNSKQK